MLSDLLKYLEGAHHIFQMVKLQSSNLKGR